MSYLLAGQGELRSAHGSYVAHGDGNRYEFTVFWYPDDQFLRWTAAVTLRGLSLASPTGSIDARVVDGNDSENWVRAAVELVIERMAAGAAREA